MYKLKLNFSSLTRVEMKFSVQPRTIARTHVQRHTAFFEIDLSLATINLQPKTNARSHVQSQIQVFEFDLSLTTIQYPTKDQCKSARTEPNSFV